MTESIKISPITHRNETRIKVAFTKTPTLLNLIKQVKGRKWSKTKNCWHIPYTKEAYQALKDVFKGYEIINLQSEVEVKSSIPTRVDDISLSATKTTSIPNSEKIVISIENDYRLKAYVPFQKTAWRKVVKAIPKSFWDTEKKYWTLPKKQETINKLEKEIGKEFLVFSEKAMINSSLVSNQTFKTNLEKSKKIISPKFKIIQKENETNKILIGDQVIINQINTTKLAVYVPSFKKGWIEIVRGITGRIWNSNEKYWEVPYVQETIVQLRRIKNCHYNFKVVSTIPVSFPIAVSHKKAIMLQKKPRLLEQLNQYQKRAILAFEELLILERKSYQTIKSYKHLIAGLFKSYPKVKPSQITGDQIRKYVLHKIQKDNIAESTQNQMINAFAAFYKRVLKQDEKLNVLKRPKKRKRLPNVFSKEEVKKLIQSISNLKHRTMIALIYSAGLRQQEIINLRKKDILFSRKCIFVYRGKGKKDRYVLLSERANVLLKEYIAVYSPKYWLFEGQTGGQYSARSMQSIFTNAKQRSKVSSYVTLHGLRHSYATHLVEANTPLHVVQEALGHESIKTTEIYLHISNKFRRKFKSPLDDLGI